MKKSSLYNYYHDDFVKTAGQKKLIDDTNFTYFNFFRYIFPKICIEKPKTILDVGSGAGTLDLYLGSRGFKVVGIDISEKAINVSRESVNYLNLSRNVKFVNTDIAKEFDSKSKFDVILCLEVIEHCKDDRKVLKKLYKLLNHHGILILSTPLSSAPLVRMGLAKKFDHFVGHLRRYGVTEITNKIKNAKFKVERTVFTEGILRNSLFVLPPLNKFIRYIKSILVYLITALDDLSGRLFGYSDIIVFARKR